MTENCDRMIALPAGMSADQCPGCKWLTMVDMLPLLTDVNWVNNEKKWCPRCGMELQRHIGYCYPAGTILVIDERPEKYTQKRFTCVVCHREFGANLKDVRLGVQPERPGWCLMCGVRAERAGAGFRGPAIAVWDEVPE